MAHLSQTVQHTPVQHPRRQTHQLLPQLSQPSQLLYYLLTGQGLYGTKPSYKVRTLLCSLLRHGCSTDLSELLHSRQQFLCCSDVRCIRPAVLHPTQRTGRNLILRLLRTRDRGLRCLGTVGRWCPVFHRRREQVVEGLLRLHASLSQHLLFRLLFTFAVFLT